MADNEYTIPLPDGSDIKIPAWASEATMQSMSIDIDAIARTDARVLTVLKGNSAKLKKLIKQQTDAAKASKTKSSQNAANTESMNEKMRSFGNNVTKAAGFLKNTDEPLSSFVDAVKAGGTAVARIAGPAIKKLIGATGDMGQKLLDGANSVGGAAGVITDAAFLFAGWNAGKLESFAAVQKQMIDTGAIIFDTKDAFNTLRESVIESGVTYNQFSQVISANGSAINAFGGNISQGTKRFQEFFKGLELSADALGDFGLSNSELLEQTGAFLEYQRTTGGLVRTTANLEQDLANAFGQLQIETTALASLTGFTRSEALQAVMDTGRMDLNVGMRYLEGEQLDAMNETKKFLNLMTQINPNSAFTTLFDAISSESARVRGDLDSMQIETVMAAMNNDDLAAIRKLLGEDFIPKLKDALVNGGQAGVISMIEEILKADLQIVGSAAAITNDALAASLKNTSMATKEFQDKMGSFSTERYEEAMTHMAESLSEAGSTQVLLNDATKAFLAIQEIVTLNMQSLASGLQSATDFFQDLINDPDFNANPYGDNPLFPGFSERQQQRQEEEQRSNSRNRSESGNPRPQFFGGPVSANMPYIVGDGPDMRQAELFVPAVDGRIMSNREVKDTMNLTDDKNTAILVDNLEKEYQMVLDAKAQVLQSLENLKKMSKEKLLDERLKDALDASSA